MTFGHFYLPYSIPLFLGLLFSFTILGRSWNYVILFATLSYIVVIVGFRFEIANDFQSYLNIYERVLGGEKFGIEPGFNIFILATQHFGGQYAQFVLSALLYSFTILLLPFNVRQKCMFALLISLTYVWGDLGTIRQTVSVLSLFLAYLSKYRIVSFLWIIACVTMHSTGVLLVLYFYFYRKVEKKSAAKIIIFEVILISISVLVIYWYFLPKDVVESIVFRFTSESLAKYTGDILLGYQGVFRLIVAIAIGFMFCRCRTAFFYFNLYFILFVILLFFTSSLFIDALANRFLSLSRFSEIFMLTQFVSRRINIVKLFVLPMIFYIFYIKGLRGFAYEYDLFYPYKSLLI